MEHMESELLILCRQARLPVLELGFTQLSCCLRRCQAWQFLNSRGYARTEGYSLKTFIRVWLQRTTSTQLIECRDVQLVWTWSLHA